MDDPKEFNINMKIREGLYYVESDTFFRCVERDGIIIL